MIDDDLDDWTTHDDGQATCRRHPDAGRFLPYVGCRDCLASPPKHDERPEPTPVEDNIVRQTGAEEADERGVKDMFDLELRADRVIRDARREAAACRRLAREHETRARDILTGKIDSSDRERDAQRWFGESTKVRALLAKNLDSEGKTIKLRLPIAIERWGAKDLRERAKLLARFSDKPRSH